MSEWQALVAGFGFYLILEGLLPFLNPNGFKKAMAVALQTPEKQLRRFGACMLVVGVIVLFAVK